MDRNIFQEPNPEDNAVKKDVFWSFCRCAGTERAAVMRIVPIGYKRHEQCASVAFLGQAKFLKFESFVQNHKSTSERKSISEDSFIAKVV